MTSIEQRLAALTPEQRKIILEGLSEEDIEQLLRAWRYNAREEQWAATTCPEHVVLFGAGRGAGKTLTGSQWVRHRIDTNTLGRPLRFGLIARTSADCRDVMIQGASGLLSVFPPGQEPRYLASSRRVDFYDGSVALMFSAEEPSQLRGPSFDYAWADELAAWDHRPDDSGLTAWDNTKIATRDGPNPQIFVSTTPKRSGPLPELYDAAKLKRGVQLFTASTYDNPHLSPTYLQTMRDLYEGTRLGAQELYAQLLQDVAGALWKQSDIDALRTPKDDIGNLPLRVVAVDPSVAENPRDECGIVVVGATSHRNPVRRHGYVLADRTVHGSPREWARAVVTAARDFDASVVAEANQGGALVVEVIRSVDPEIQVKTVHAKKGKKLRAEPVQMAYEQGRVSHLGNFPLLEAQMTSWVPGESAKSPDRVDALVYGLAALLVPSSAKVGFGQATIHRAQGRVPMHRASAVQNLRRLPLHRR